MEGGTDKFFQAISDRIQEAEKELKGSYAVSASEAIRVCDIIDNIIMVCDIIDNVIFTHREKITPTICYLKFHVSENDHQTETEIVF